MLRLNLDKVETVLHIVLLGIVIVEKLKSKFNRPNKKTGANYNKLLPQMKKTLSINTKRPSINFL